MSKHVYLRAYMAGVTVPSILLLFLLTAFCVLRLGLNFPMPIERALVFPMALVPNIWGFWNVLYVVVRRHRNVPIGLYGAVVPLLAGPLGLGTAWAVGFEIPRFVLSVFPVALAVAIAAYYLVWKYIVGFFNRMLEIA